MLKGLFHISLIILSCSVFAQENSSDESLSLKKEFIKQTDAWIKGYNSKDANNLTGLYAEDAVYISGHVTGLELDGRNKVIEYFQKGINGGGHIDKIEILSIHFSGDMAALLCKYQATNSGVTVVGRNLLVMKKINGKWLISIHMTVV